MFYINWILPTPLRPIPPKKNTLSVVIITVHDDLAKLSFVLKVPIFAKAYLDPSRTSMMKAFAKIGESRELF